MTVARHVVFPALRLLVWAVIAAALVKLAFFGGAAAAPAGAVDVPGAVFTDPVATVTTGTVSNTVTVDATVTADPAADAKATMEGTVGYLAVADGAHVEAGAALLEVRQEVPVDPVERVDAEGNVTVVQQKPRIKRSTVAAPVAGTVSLRVLHRPAGRHRRRRRRRHPWHVLGDRAADGGAAVPPARRPERGERRGPRRPRPLHLHRADHRHRGHPGRRGPSVPGDPFAPPVEASATVEVRCAVPADVTVFPGLAGTMTVTAGQASDVLVVPVTAVQGLFATGNVWTVGAEGAEPTKKKVGLGMTDGQVVQITEGLAEGDTILEFIPIGDVPPVGGQEMVVGRGF